MIVTNVEPQPPLAKAASLPLSYQSRLGEKLLVCLLHQYAFINRELPIRLTNTCVLPCEISAIVWGCFFFLKYEMFKYHNFWDKETYQLLFCSKPAGQKIQVCFKCLKYFIITVFISIMCTFITSRCYKNPVSSNDCKMELSPYLCNTTYQYFYTHSLLCTSKHHVWCIFMTTQWFTCSCWNSHGTLINTNYNLLRQ